MGEKLRFDGRVAIVTGAGGNQNLGSAFAKGLAAHGACVVVNDLGVGPDGRGVLRAPADVVVDEIRAAGGEAVADANSVAEEDSARAIVQTAIDAWGRVDIVVNNAGILHAALFEELSGSDLARIVQVHLFGNIWMCRAVWPLMKQRRYGRIVNVSSGALLGGKYGVTYGAAKAGIYGLTRGLAVEGKDFGIKVNALGPTAHTSAYDYMFDDVVHHGATIGHPDLVTPAVGVLAHEDCPVSGKFINSGAGHSSELYFSETVGYTSETSAFEELRDNFAAVIDRDNAREIPDPGVTDGPMHAEHAPKPYRPDQH